MTDVVATYAHAPVTPRLRGDVRPAPAQSFMGDALAFWGTTVPVSVKRDRLVHTPSGSRVLLLTG